MGALYMPEKYSKTPAPHPQRTSTPSDKTEPPAKTPATQDLREKP
jgi:hypothetical protein